MVADLILKGGCVVTMDGDRRILEDGMVVVSGDVIAAVGDRSELERSYEAKRVIDTAGAVLTPGLVDAHNHPIHFLSKGIADDLELSERSYRRVWPYEAALTEDEAGLSALGTFAEMIRNGTTCFCDPGSYRPDAVAVAARDIGIRGIVSREAWDVPDENAPATHLESAQTAVERGEQFVERWNGAAGDRIRAWFSLVRPSHVTDELCRRTKERADALGVGIHAHMTISRTSDENTRRVVGRGSALRRFGDLGVLDRNLLLAHLGWVEDDDIRLLVDRDVKAVHCPSASMLGAFGVVAHGRIPEMLDAGLTVSLGSDAGAISRFVDLIRVSYLAACAHKDARMDATVMGAHAAFEMATIGGARALLWDDRIGSLEPGKAADLVVFDTSELEWHPNPLRNPVANLVYSASGRSARTVLIDGEVVMEDRRLTRLDVDDLRRRAAVAADEVLDRIGVVVAPRWPVRAPGSVS